MISYLANGPILTVEAAGIGDEPARLTLSIIIDRHDVLDPAHIHVIEDGWQAQLPAAVYDGKPHRIALDIATEGRSIERTAFSFAATTEVVAVALDD